MVFEAQNEENTETDYGKALNELVLSVRDFSDIF